MCIVLLLLFIIGHNLARSVRKSHKPALTKLSVRKRLLPFWRKCHNRTKSNTWRFDSDLIHRMQFGEYFFGIMGSLHRLVAVLVPDEKLNCFWFWQKKLFKTKRDYFHPGPVETPSGWWLPIGRQHDVSSNEFEYELCPCNLPYPNLILPYHSIHYAQYVKPIPNISQDPSS